MPARVLLYTLLLIVLWGSHAAVAALTMASGGENPLTSHAFLFYTLVFADVCLAAIMVATGRWRVLRSYSWGRIGRLAFAGLFGYFLYYVTYFWALERANPEKAVAEAAIINYLFPMCTLFASAAILGERLTARSVVAAVVAFAGAWVVVSRGHLSQAAFMHPAVDLLAFAAAACWGIFSALGRRWRYEPLTGMFVFITTGLVLSALVLPFTAGRKVPVGWEFYGCFHVGFLCNTLGVILWFLALKHGGASLAGNLSLLGSFVSLVFIRLLRPDQEITWSAFAGLCLIVFGVLLSRKTLRAAAPPDAIGPDE